jgi:hypothetical protein
MANKKEPTSIKGIWVKNPKGRKLMVREKEIDELLKKGFKKIEEPKKPKE